MFLFNVVHKASGLI